QEHLPSDVAKIDVRRKYNTFTGSTTLKFTPTAWLSSRLVTGIDRGQERNQDLWPMEVEVSPVYPQSALGAIWIEKPITTNISMDLSATARHQATSALSTATSVGAQYFIKSFEKL